MPRKRAKTSEPKKPGDLILDRILPDANPKIREEAREALRRYGQALLRLGERIEQEQKFEVSRRATENSETVSSSSAEK